MTTMQERMMKPMTIVGGAALALSVCAAWAVAFGLGACVASAGETPGTPIVVEVPPPPAVPEPGHVEAPAPTAAPSAPGRVVIRGKRDRVPRTPAAPTAPMAPLPEEISAKGWFGMAFTCSECTIQPRTPGNAPVWSFAEPPEVYRVESGGPAERAGIKPGDILVRIDGLAMDSPEGGRRFGAVEPGQKVKWVIKRGAALKSLLAVAGERPGHKGEGKAVVLGERLARLRTVKDMEQVQREIERVRTELSQLQLERMSVTQTQAQARAEARRAGVRQPIRYAGTVGGCSDVEVRSFGPVNVTVSREGDELVITTGEATVRVKVGEGEK
jgi:membrane-associated protease RseP (regulator of RpoE activity)